MKPNIALVEGLSLCAETAAGKSVLSAGEAPNWPDFSSLLVP